MNNKCNIARDLMPLYIDDVASEESIDYVDEHVAECEPCLVYFESMKTPSPMEASKGDASDQAAFTIAIAKLRKKHRWRILRNVLIGFIIALMVAVFLLPLPLKVTKEFEGLMYAYGQYTEPMPCKITLNGTKYVYLLKPSVYDGAFAVSTDDRTLLHGARLNTFIRKGHVSHMTYLTDQGYITTGYFVSPNNLDWLYIRSEDEDGEIYEIMASAENSAEALEIKQAAIDRLSLLPQLGDDDI